MPSNLNRPENAEIQQRISKPQKIDDLWKNIQKDKEGADSIEKHTLKEIAFYAYHFEGESKSEISRCLSVTRQTVAQWITEMEKSVVLEEDVRGYVDKTIVRAETIYQKLLSKRRYTEAWKVWKDLVELLQSFGKIHKEADSLKVAHTMTLQDFRESKEQYDESSSGT